MPDISRDLSVQVQVELALRRALGLGPAAAVGLEREWHRQPAGFRAHSLVTLGAAQPDEGRPESHE